MQDARTLSYLNMYAILGSLVQLCQLDKRAGELVKDAHVSIGFAVKDGPQATLSFREGKVTLLEGVEKCTIRLPFSSPEKFNGMIDGVVTPIPTKGITKVGFLLHTFKELTDILTEYLRPSEEKLQDEVFFRTSTTLMLHVIALRWHRWEIRIRSGAPAPPTFRTVTFACPSERAPRNWASVSVQRIMC